MYLDAFLRHRRQETNFEIYTRIYSELWNKKNQM